MLCSPIPSKEVGSVLVSWHVASSETAEVLLRRLYNKNINKVKASAGPNLMINPVMKLVK